jgi:hypothetical protein
MKHTKSIPFDWETYNQNKNNIVRKYKVMTLTGQEVTQLTKFDCGDELNLVGVVNGHIVRTNAEHIHLQHEIGLPEQWVNVHLGPNNRLEISSKTFQTKEEAEFVGNRKANYLITIELTKAIN